MSRLGDMSEEVTPNRTVNKGHLSYRIASSQFEHEGASGNLRC